MVITRLVEEISRITNLLSSLGISDIRNTALDSTNLYSVNKARYQLYFPLTLNIYASLIMYLHLSFGKVVLL